jgi:hypothetical protein
MKLKVKVKDFEGGEKVLEKEGRNLDHLKVQQTYKRIVFRDKKKFYRKKKHKKREDLDI